MTYIKFKRSAVAGKVPSVSDIDLGELAINTFDGKLFIKKDNGTQSIVDLTAGGGGGSGTVTSVSGAGTVSGLTLTGTVTTSGSLTLGGTLALTSSDITTGLGFTPYNASNPAGYTSNVGTVTSVSGTGTVNGITLTGSVTSSGSLTLGGTLSGINLTTQVTGILPIANGGTNASTASGARTSLGAAASGANSDITSLSGITGGISTVDFITYDTAVNTTPTAGQVGWNTTFGTNTRALGNGTVILDGMDVVVYARNDETTTLTKGTVVYISGATGDHASVKRAINTGDSTSAMTIGFVKDDIAAGANGYIVTQGVVNGLNLGSYTAGDIIYLGSTAGTFTKVKPYAPNHIVILGVVERANSGNGQIYVKVNNGWELDELHNVSAVSPSNNDGIFYNTSTNLWEAKSIVTALGYTPYNATNPAGYTSNVGTVTSVSGTGTINGITLTGSVTSSGSLTLGGTLSGVSLTTQVTGTLPVGNGGTGATTLAANNVILGNGTSAVQTVAPGTNGNVLTSNGTTWVSAPAAAGGLSQAKATAFSMILGF